MTTFHITLALGVALAAWWRLLCHWTPNASAPKDDSGSIDYRPAVLQARRSGSASKEVA